MAVDYDLTIVGGTAAARWAAITAVQYHARVALVGIQQYRSNVAIGTPAALASLGIDVIAADGTFDRKPHLYLQVENREVRSHHYLLAMAPPIACPPTYLTAEQAYTTAQTRQDLATWHIYGDGPAAVQLSQTLARRGAAVVLVVRSHLLPTEEPDAVQLIQGQLEADGVEIFTHTTELPSTHASTSAQKVWATEGSVSLSPQLQSLNLRHTTHGLWVDAHLRTSHPRIYACGPILGGYTLPHIAHAEARLAVKNALFLPTRTMAYNHLPWVISTQPPLARVGLTTAQAQQQYRNIQVFRQPYSRLEVARRQGQTTGICQLIARDNGVLVGAHLVGAAAAEVVHLLALAVQHQYTIDAIADWPLTDTAFSNIISQTAQRSHPQRDLLERFFHRRRRWNL